MSCVIGTIELVDVSAELPGLKYSRGLTTWKVGQCPHNISFNFIQGQGVTAGSFSEKSFQIDINSFVTV